MGGLMRHLTLLTVLFTFISIAEARPAQTGGTAAKTLPRTADGKPDLQGIWQVQNRASYDLQEHGARFGMPAGPGVVEGGQIPYQPWAAAKKQENFANRQKLDPLAQCFMPGVPRIMYMEFPFQVFQTRDHIAMTFEWSQVYRLIYTNGKPGPQGIEFWMGDSRGRWEGDTLVVQTIGFPDGIWLDRNGTPMTNAAKITERFRRLNFGTMEIEITVDDPKAYTRPWTIKMTHKIVLDMELIDYICIENEKDYGHLIGK